MQLPCSLRALSHTSIRGVGSRSLSEPSEVCRVHWLMRSKSRNWFGVEKISLRLRTACSSRLKPT